jgi:hypothetical protein
MSNLVLWLAGGTHRFEEMTETRGLSIEFRHWAITRLLELSYLLRSPPSHPNTCAMWSCEGLCDREMGACLVWMVTLWALSWAVGSLCALMRGDGC